MDVVMDDVANEIEALIDNALQKGEVPVPDPNDSLPPLQTIGAIRLNSSLKLLAAMADIDALFHCIVQDALFTEIQRLILVECTWKQVGTYNYKGDVHIDLTLEDIDSVFGL